MPKADTGLELQRRHSWLVDLREIDDTPPPLAVGTLGTGLREPGDGRLDSVDKQPEPGDATPIDSARATKQGTGSLADSRRLGCPTIERRVYLRRLHDGQVRACRPAGYP